MKTNYPIVLLLIVTLFTQSNSVFSQTEISGKEVLSDSVQADPVEVLYYSGDLPPLDLLIDSAILRSPLVLMSESMISKKEYELVASRFEWLQQTAVTAETKAGSFGSNQQLESLTVGKSLGLSVKIPLTAIVGNRARQKVRTHEIEAAIHQKDAIIDQVRQIVIRQYNIVQLKKTLVQLKSKSSQSTSIHYEMAELEFNEGAIPVSELSRVMSIATKESSEFEVAKSEFKTEYMILEDIVGIDFRFLKINNN